MAEIASAFVSIVPSTRGFGTKLNAGVGASVRSSGTSLGRTFGKMFVLGSAVIAAAGIGNFLKGSIEEAREAQKTAAQTNAVLKSTGGVANVTAGQVGKLATALSLKIGVDDEAIQAGENMLLTFTKVRNEVGKGNDIFNQATVTVQDMAAAFGGDAVSNSKILGKALNDPVKGVSALTRVGVQFTQGQKDQIAAMVATGNVMGAQKLILGELAKQTAGSAEAQATNADKARVAWANLKEQVGTALLPVLDRLAAVFSSKIAPAISSFISNLGSGRGAAGAFGDFIRNQLVPALVTAWGVFKNQIIPVVQTLAQIYLTKVVPAVAAFEVALAQRLYPVLLQVVGIIRDQVIPTITALAQFFVARILPVIISTAQAVATNLKPVFDQLVTTLQTKVLPGVSKLLAKFEEYRPTIQRVVEVTARLIGGFIQISTAILGKVLPVVIRLAAFLIGNLFNAIGGTIVQIARGVGAVISFGQALVKAIQAGVRFANGVIEAGKKVINFFQDLPGKIKSFFAGLPGDMARIGGQIIDGLVNGIKAAAGRVAAAVQAIVSKIPGKIRSVMGISSPSKVTTELGRYIGEGLARGVADSEKKVADATQKMVDNLKSKLDTLKSEFASIKDSVAGAFTGNLFEATTAGDFIASLTSTQGQLTALKAAFKTLKGWGISPAFLSQMFASGNGALILDLAAGSEGQAQMASDLFGSDTKLSDQLGGAVAKNDPIGRRIDKTNDKLDSLVKETKANTKAVHDSADRFAGALDKISAVQLRKAS